MTRLLPAPPMADDGTMWSADWIAAGVVQGSLGVCVACEHTCWTWWSATPPSGYVALHGKCAGVLRDLWHRAMTEGEADTRESPVRPERPTGAYARRRASLGSGTQARSTAVAIAARVGVELPADFEPGPFWKPGYTEAEPWVTLAQAGCGQVFVPFGSNRDRAVEHLRRLRLVPVVLHSVDVVGAVLLAPDGSRADGWGQEPRHGVVRWSPLTRLSEWRACTGCGSARWPGSWVTVSGGRCRSCTEPLEVDDPRPWPADPAFPGLATAPHWLGGPKPVKRRKVVHEGS
ncbi:MAG: hypothetical protein HOY78_02280 [Saccharothrix sp.]|nr:hypothetical protein [Saccharothrix sp.]